MTVTIELNHDDLTSLRRISRFVALFNQSVMAVSDEVDMTPDLDNLNELIVRASDNIASSQDEADGTLAHRIYQATR